MTLAGYFRGDFTTRDQTEQLPDISKVRVHQHTIQIRNSKLSGDELFKQLTWLPGFPGRVAGRPARPGRTLTFSLPFPFNLGQVPFQVRIRNYDPGTHLFSAVTLAGHPITGYRFWRVFELDNGDWVVQTGALEHPTRLPDLVKDSWLGGHSAAMGFWRSMLLRMLELSGGDRVTNTVYDRVEGVDDPGRRDEFLQYVQ